MKEEGVEMNKKLKTIIEDIFKMESTDLNAVVDAIKMRRNQLHTSDAHQFRVGDRVSFAGRHGSTLKGVVEKVPMFRARGASTTPYRLAKRSPLHQSEPVA